MNVVTSAVSYIFSLFLPAGCVQMSRKEMQNVVCELFYANMLMWAEAAERRSQPVRLCNLCHVLFLPSFQSDGFLKDNNNAAQRLLDGVKYISQSVSELSVKPAKAVTSWLTDQIAPTYWKPNSLILVYDYNWTKTRTNKNCATTLV